MEGEALSDSSAPVRPTDPLIARALAEIEAEAHRIRRDAEVPPEEEARLDRLFLRLTPTRAKGEGWRQAVALMRAFAPVDPTPPLASRKPGGRAVKRAVAALIEWYLRAVGVQVERFHAAACRAVDELGAMAEQSVRGATSLRGLDVPVGVLGLPADAPSWWWELAAAVCRGATGRVLHAECGTGAFVEALLEQGVDAYGVDPRPVEDDPKRVGLDLRQGDLLEHLLAVEEASLGAIVLTGVVERLAPSRLVALVEQAVGRVTYGGSLVVASATPAAFERTAPRPVVELAPGRPLSADTWVVLLEHLGLDVVERQAAPPGLPEGYAVVARRSGAPERA
jgi:hypothetical protein